MTVRAAAVEELALLKLINHERLKGLLYFSVDRQCVQLVAPPLVVRSLTQLIKALTCLLKF